MSAFLPELFWLSASWDEMRSHPGLQVMPSAQQLPWSLLSWVPGNVAWFWGSQGGGLSCWATAMPRPCPQFVPCPAGIALASSQPHVGVSARAPQPSTHLALIWHLVGRVMLLHHLRSQHLEAPAELGEEQSIRIPWGHTGVLGAAPGSGHWHWHAGEGPAGTSCAQRRAPGVEGTWGAAMREKPRQ